MSFITIFTTPKPFASPHIDIIQRNAIQSWSKLGQDIEVILVGNEQGMAQVAAEYRVRHLPDVTCNEYGTPLVSSIFELARQASNSPLLLYVNADILLLPDILRAAHVLLERYREFLLVGQRWDLDVRKPLLFDSNWAIRLREDVLVRGRRHVPAGSDYFLFPRHLFSDLPDFAIGRAGWDNWMIYHAVTQTWPAIDGTHDVMIVHQDHDYGHLPGGRPHYDLEETSVNAVLGGGLRNMYMMLDTERELINGRVSRPRFRLARFVRRIERILQPEEQVGLRWQITRRFRWWRRALVERGA
jgi:hypothetical protein